MSLLNVYGKLPLTPVSAKGSWVTDKDGTQYLDFYGGHGVISIGHQHPTWVKALTQQIEKISFYSNAVELPQQEEAAKALKKASNLLDYEVFFCNSGAEANENALKLAAWQNDKKKLVAVEKAFHGRTLSALQITDNPSILSPLGSFENTTFVPLNDEDALKKAITKEVAAFVIEGIQGVAGVNEPTAHYLELAQKLCKENNVCLILDEVQSGAGRTGKFFAFQHFNIKPDIITSAKGLGNGFPVAAVLVAPHLHYKLGMLGTTFGGNYMACQSVTSVCETILNENLLEHTLKQGEKIKTELLKLNGISSVRGKGLMLGMVISSGQAKPLQVELLKQGVITGTSSAADTLRILPPLNINDSEVDFFLNAISKALKNLS